MTGRASNMDKLVRLPLCEQCNTEYGGLAGLQEELRQLGCGGVEGIWNG